MEKRQFNPLLIFIIISLLISVLCNGCAAIKPRPLSANLAHYLKDYKKINYNVNNNSWKKTGIVLGEGDFVQVCVTGEIRSPELRASFGNKDLTDSSLWLKGRVGKNGKEFNLLKPNHTGNFLAKDIEDEDDFEIGCLFDNKSSYREFLHGNLKIDILVWKNNAPEFVLAGLEKLHKLYPENPRIRRLLANQRSVVAFEELAETDISRAVKSLKQNIAFREKREKLHRVELYDIAKDYYRLYLISKSNSTRKDKKPPSFFREKALETMRLALKEQTFLNQLTVDDQETLFFKTFYLKTYVAGIMPFPVHKSLGFCYLSLAWYFSEIGLFDQSIAYLKKGSDISKNEGYKHIESVCILGLSGTNIQLGKYEKAIRQARIIIERYDGFLYKSIKDSVNPLNFAYLCLAFGNALSGNLQEALVYADILVEIDASNTIFPSVGWLTKGLASISRNEPLRAREEFKRALEMSEMSVFSLPLFLDLNQIGIAGTYILEEKPEQALTILEGMNPVAEIDWRRQALAAVAYLQLGQEKKSLEHMKKGIGIIEKSWRHMGSQGTKMGAMKERSAMYDLIVAFLFEMNQYEEAFNYSEFARGRVFMDTLGNKDLKTKDKKTLAVNNRINDLRKNLITMKGEVSLSRRNEDVRAVCTTSTRDIIETEKALEQEINRLKETDFEFMSTIMVDPLKISDVKKMIPHDVSMVSYFIPAPSMFGGTITGSLLGYETVVYAWVIDKGKVTGIRIPVSKERLERMVRSFRAAVMEPGTNRDFILEHAEVVKKDQKDISKELYDLLISPVKNYITNKRVCIIPHNILHYLPFSALYDGSKYLVEDYAIFYSPSATVLKYCFDKSRPGKNRFFGMGNPKLEKVAYDLPFAQKEVEQISNTFTNATVFYRNDASEERFKDLAKNEELIHLASHGEYKSDTPMLSNLRLSPSGREDGKLEVHEIFDLDLKPNLVVLSACQTGMGKQSAGDEITGLSRAFIYAGTPSIITTLWSVNDKSTSDLMVSFYKNYKNKPKVEALQTAQLEIMKKYPQPFYWAPFSLTGDYK